LQHFVKVVVVVANRCLGTLVLAFLLVLRHACQDEKRVSHLQVMQSM
jgi:hypothetical protein